MAIPVSHVLGSQLVIFADKRRDAQGEGVGHDVFVDRAAVQGKFLRRVSATFLLV